MRVWGVTALLVAVVLAGCSEDAGKIDEVADDFDDVDVEVTEDTGAILGVVVNDAIIPIEAASVQVLNTELATETDIQGRFAFSKVAPGTYFLAITKAFHEPVQTSIEVKPGVKDPPVAKIQLNRAFKGEPYMQTIANEGFFTCTQAGVPGYLYSSSPCHSPASGARLCEDLNLVCLPQNRDFHADVNEGWQTQVFEMTWEPSASGTSEGMGIVVSTYKPERAGSHWFAEFEGNSPIYGRMDCNLEDPGGACASHPSASGADPTTIPNEGIKQMSYFMSVRPPDGAVCVIWCVPPGLAVDQRFDVWLSQFYFLPAPEEWSFIAGDPNPFA